MFVKHGVSFQCLCWGAWTSMEEESFGGMDQRKEQTNQFQAAAQDDDGDGDG